MPVIFSSVPAEVKDLGRSFLPLQLARKASFACSFVTLNGMIYSGLSVPENCYGMIVVLPQ